jgi:hydrophobe/amphiphile efflux-1 (HAE1) family protein
MVLPTGFIPNEDQGVFFLEVRLPEGASAERTKRVSQQVQAMLDEDLTGIQDVMVINGFSILDGSASTNSAFGILTLLPWEDRYPTKVEQFLGLFGISPKQGRPRGREMTSNALAMKWMQRFMHIPEAVVMVYQPPPVAGLGTSGGIEYQLLDRGNNGIDELYKVAQELLQRARETGDFSAIQTTFSPYAPRYYLDIDRDKVQKMEISLDSVFSALQGYYGSVYVNDFNAFNSVFGVFAQALGEYRDSPEDVLNMRFKNSEGKMVPMRSVAEIHEVVGPQRIPRFQMYTTAYVQGQLVPGVSTGQGMQTLEELSKDLPQGFGFNWTGMSYQEAAVGSVIVIVFALCVAFAFLVLAAQYESWTSPLIILMAVPLAIGGALLFVALRGIDVNIYTQVGFILMVGLSAKNAILITEFATENRRHGEPVVQAAYEAGRLRLRPIMMTSFAFILGMIPLVTASGAGAVSRHAIGTPVFGGVLTETMIGVYTTPVLFVLLTLWSEAFGKTFRKMMGKDSEK